MFSLSNYAIFLTVVCGLGFAASDYYRKKALINNSPQIVLLLFILVQVPILASWMIINGGMNLTIDYWPVGILVALVGLFANLFFLFSLRENPISMTIPILGLVPVLTVIFGSLVIKEMPSNQQLIGIILSTFGLTIIYSPDKNFNPLLGIKRLFLNSGTRYMFVVALLWALAGPLDKICMINSSPATHGFIQTMLISTTLIVYLTATDKRTLLNINYNKITPALIAAICASIAYGCQLIAYQNTYVSLVEIIKRAIGFLSAIIIGYLFFKEPLTKSKFLGVIFILCGIYLIIFPSIL